MDLADLKAAPLAPIGAKKFSYGCFQHLKSGGEYVVVVPAAKLEADGTPVVVYESVKDRQVWVRPESEFREKFAKLGPDHNLPWPSLGEKFDIVVAVIPVDDSTMAYVLDADTEVEEVLRDDGGIMDSPTFRREDIPKEVGVYRLRIEYWFQGHGEDAEWGFIVHSCTRLS